MIRQKDVDAVVDSALETLEISNPPQIVESDDEVIARHESVADVKGVIAGTATIGDILVERIVSGDPRIERIVARKFKVQLRPSTPASDFLASEQIDALADPANEVAEVSAPPAFTAHCDDFCYREHVVKTDKLFPEAGAADHRFVSIQPSVYSGDSNSR